MIRMPPEDSTQGRRQSQDRRRRLSPTIRVVVATYKRPDDLATFLQALAPQVRGRSHVRLVVINDGTHDERYARVVEPYLDMIDYHPHPANLGPGPIRMVACENAEEDYIVFTDDDCIAPPGWLGWLEAMIQTFPEVDLFAGTTKPVNSARPGLVEKYLCLSQAFPKPFVSKRGLVVAVTANLAVKRVLFEHVGGFHPDFNQASEDLNLTYRLLEAGARYRVCREWVIGHKAEQTLRATLHRFYHYGRGSAQHVLFTKDWHLANEVYRGFSIRDTVSMITFWMNGQQNSPESKMLPAPVQLLYRWMAALIAVQNLRGWHNGLRHYSREYGVDVPKTAVTRPSLASFIEHPGSPISNAGSAGPSLANDGNGESSGWGKFS